MKVVLVTDGNSGTSLATAKLFGQQGAKVVIRPLAKVYLKMG